jgi:ribosomal protein S18 acetylase RimI-like enzyme
MIIREAAPADNQALRELQARCPQGTSLKVSTVNTPDFFARVKVYHQARVLVAEEGGRIVGSAAGAIRPGRVGDTVASVGYQFQAFVDPEFRRQGVADALLDDLERYLAEQGAVLIYCLIMEGNDPSLGLVTRRGFTTGRDLVMTVLPVYRALRVPDPEAIRPAGRNDLPAVADLLNDTWGGAQLFSKFSAGGLEEIIERTPGLSLDQVLIHRVGGRVTATAAWWDWGAVIRVTVLEVSRRLKRLSRRLRLIGLFRPVPSVARPGQVLRQVMLTGLGGRDPAALNALFRALNNRLKARGIEQMFVVSETDSPVTAALDGFIQVPSGLHLLIKPLAAGPVIGPGPVFVDGVDL